MSGNRYQGDVTLKMGGRKYLLRYDWEAIGKLKTELGSNFDEIIAAASMEMDLPVIAKALAIGLERHHQGEVTAEKIISMSPPVVKVTDVLNGAITKAFYGDKLPTELTDENPTIAARLKNLILTLFRKRSKLHTATV